MRKYWTMFLWHVFRIHPRFLSKKDGIKYAGQYVCLKSFGSRKVVSANADPLIAIAEARKKGYKDPVCFMVNDKPLLYSNQTAAA